jgi:hypothetical protein
VVDLLPSAAKYAVGGRVCCSALWVMLCSTSMPHASDLLFGRLAKKKSPLGCWVSPSALVLACVCAERDVVRTIIWLPQAMAVLCAVQYAVLCCDALSYHSVHARQSLAMIHAMIHCIACSTWAQ